MCDFIIRLATFADTPFLVDAIVESEKSGTDVFSYSTVLGISECEARKYIDSMLQEEIDGCELSVSSFMVAVKDGHLIAAVAAWIEGLEGIPSSILKGNLLNYFLPKECIEKAMGLNEIVKELYIEFIPKTIHIGIVYVPNEYRGLGLSRILIEAQIKRLRLINPSVSQSCLHVFGCNNAAIKSYEKLGFKTTKESHSSKRDVLDYFPSGSKLLMKRQLKND